MQYKNPWREELVQQIKDVGQELIDRAESLVGQDLDLVVEISINAVVGRTDVSPTIDISTTVLNKTLVDRITMNNERN